MIRLSQQDYVTQIDSLIIDIFVTADIYTDPLSIRSGSYTGTGITMYVAK
jgi:hypothetical protein